MKLPEIDFIGKRKIALIFSSGLIILSIVLFIIKGLNYGIDFKGGTLFEVKFNTTKSISTIRNALKSIPSYELQSTLGGKTFIITIKGKKEELESIKNNIVSSFLNVTELNDFSLERIEYVGPKISEFIKRQSIKAVVFALIGIILYVGIRFKSLIWGIGGVLALIHDVIISLGFISLFNIEMTITLVAALLTLAGYSINDTIVIYDRIREVTRLHRTKSFGEIINLGLNHTLNRTILTSLTTILALIFVFILGAASVKDFAKVLIFGVIIGTYSSIFVASPLVYIWHKK